MRKLLSVAMTLLLLVLGWTNGTQVRGAEESSQSDWMEKSSPDECLTWIRSSIFPEVPKYIERGKGNLKRITPDPLASLKALPPMATVLKTKDVVRFDQLGVLSATLLFAGHREQGEKLIKPYVENAEMMLGKANTYHSQVMSDWGFFLTHLGEYKEAETYLAPSTNQMEMYFASALRDNLSINYLCQTIIKDKDGKTDEAKDFAKKYVELVAGRRGPELVKQAEKNKTIAAAQNSVEKNLDPQECLRRVRDDGTASIAISLQKLKEIQKKHVPDPVAYYKKLDIVTILRKKDLENFHDLASIADCLLYDGHKEKALEAYKNFADNFDIMMGGKSHHLAYLQADFGFYFTSQGQYEEAESYLIPSIRYMEKNYTPQIKTNLATNYLCMAMVNDKQGSAREALSYSKKWMDLTEGKRGNDLVNGIIEDPVTEPTPIASKSAAQPETPKVAEPKPEETKKNIGPVKDKWALVIGISKFKKPGIDLRYAAKDAEDFYNYLVTEGGFKRDHVCLLLNEKATRQNIMTAFGSKFLPSYCEPGDMVVIYISTHGTPSQVDQGKSNFIVAHDTDPNDLFPTGVDMDEMYRRIKNSVLTDRTLIVMDTCYSGAGVPGKGLVRQANFDANTIAQGTGTLVITSSSNDEQSYESTNCQNSIFTKYLLRALKKSGGKVDLKSAFDEAKENVRWEAKSTYGKSQIPQLGGHWQGEEMILSTPAVRPREAFNVPFAVTAPQKESPKPIRKKMKK